MPIASGAGVIFAVPAIVLGSAASVGVALSAIRSDSTIAAFDLIGPTSVNILDAVAIGDAAFAARRNHSHPVPLTAEWFAVARLFGH